MKGDVAQPMQDEMIKFENGNAIYKEGTYVYDNGTKKTTLEDGQKVDMKGILIARPVMDDKPVQDIPAK